MTETATATVTLLDRLRPFCRRLCPTGAEWMAAPFTVRVGEQDWTAATDGYILLAVPGRLTDAVPTEVSMPKVLALLTGPPERTVTVPVARLREFVGLSAEPQPCPKCANSGDVRCPACGGATKVRCLDCGGTGKGECPCCEQDIECDNCEGVGTQPCGDCDGTGTVFCECCGVAGAGEPAPAVVQGTVFDRRLVARLLAALPATPTVVLGVQMVPQCPGLPPVPCLRVEAAGWLGLVIGMMDDRLGLPAFDVGEVKL